MWNLLIEEFVSWILLGGVKWKASDEDTRLHNWNKYDSINTIVQII
jgi:hypothetical protein